MNATLTKIAFCLLLMFWLSLGLCWAQPATPTPAPSPAATPVAASAPGNAGSGEMGNPIMMVMVLAALGLAPFVLIMLTSFIKIAVVLSILRSALGTQQVPPNQVITGLAFLLTIFIMAPVGQQMYREAGPIANSKDIFSEQSVKSLWEAGKTGKEPLRKFLVKHAHEPDRVMFLELQARLASSAGEAPGRLANDAFLVLIPAFVTSELKEAFQVGFLVYLPFLILDLIIGNVLLTMGMNMLTPSVISLPFKLLVFVVVDGWTLIVKGLVLSYI